MIAIFDCKSRDKPAVHLPRQTIITGVNGRTNGSRGKDNFLGKYICISLQCVHRFCETTRVSFKGHVKYICVCRSSDFLQLCMFILEETKFTAVNGNITDCVYHDYLSLKKLPLLCLSYEFYGNRGKSYICDYCKTFSCFL